MSRPAEVDDFQGEPDLSALAAAYKLLKTEPKAGLAMLEELASKGSLMSMLYLADAYRKGVDVSADVDAAKKWLQRATDEGSRVAPHQLGLLYLDMKELQQAEAMFELGASWSYLPSLYRLGWMYADGVGVARQPVLARKFFESASSKGHVFAKRRLAGLLLRGEGGPVDVMRGLGLYVSGLFGAVVGAISDPEGQRMRS